MARKVGRPIYRFKIYSKAPGGKTTQRGADTVEEAWDWYAYYTKSAPNNEITIVDVEEDVEARSE